jgi:N-acetylmuramoyl-L-alanine amidase
LQQEFVKFFASTGITGCLLEVSSLSHPVESLALDCPQTLHAVATVMKIPRTRSVLVALFLLLLAASLTNAFDSVVIDPGHGGNDEGTAWYHVKEKDTTLAVALRLEKLLRKNDIKCVLTRRTDTYLSLDERVKIANRHPHSLLVSIHFNGSSKASAGGFSTYYFPKSPSGMFVARTIQEALDESHDTPNRGIASQDYAVLVRTLGCAVLVECGFLSNKAEATQFASAGGQQWLAEALSLGILRAKPVIINDPPETQIAKCEVYAKRLEQKEHQRQASVAPAKPAMTPKPASKKK